MLQDFFYRLQVAAMGGTRQAAPETHRPRCRPRPALPVPQSTPPRRQIRTRLDVLLEIHIGHSVRGAS